LSVTIENVGPIERLEIPIPEGGGLVVLRGGQGVGKSTAVEAVGSVLGGKAKGLTARDGEAKGTVEFGSARLTIGARTTRKGKVEVAELESRLDIAKLVDPQIDDTSAADAARIKALVNLAGVKADPTAYYELVGGREAFDALGVDVETDSPVELAGRVKRALESNARSFEKTAQQETGKAAGANAIADGLDLNAESDEAKLREAYDSARDVLTQLQERQRAFADQEETRRQASAALQNAESSYKGPDPSAAAANVELTGRALSEALEKKNRFEAAKIEAERLYNQAATDLASRQHDHNTATAELSRAEQHYRQIEDWRASLGTSVAAGPTDNELTAASNQVQAAAKALEAGAAIRTAKLQQETAKQHVEAANQAKNVASILRSAAKSTDEILSSLIPSGALRVEAGRLVLATDRGAAEPFTDLSDGERWAVAIDLAANQLPEGGLLTVPQIAFEGLTQSTRNSIHEHAKRRGVVILTAEAIDGDLAAEEYQP